MSILYKYKAIDASGKIRHDSIEADNILDLEKRLMAMGMDLINFRKKNPSIISFKTKSISRQDLINFTFQMQQLTKSGVSILDGLEDLKDSANTNRMQEVLSGIIDEIQGGKTFSLALAEFPEIFDTVYITLIQVGEESGHLPQVLHDMAETLKWHDELIAHTKKIMIYPAIVTVVIVAVVSYLMIALVPELIPFIEDLGGEIPIHTRALIATSSFLGNYWYLVFGTPISLFFILQALARRRPDVRMILDRIKLKIYIFGPLILKINLARFSNYFAMMYASGITVLDALKISELLMGNAVLTKSIQDVRAKIADGQMISESFYSVNTYPPLVIRMLKVGENTGALDEALLNISYFYNREVKESVDKMEASMTPVLTIILGGIMMWIMSAVLGPIYDSLTKIQL
ncbi:Type II secretory pathway, component PulF / Type IV fimbrial assembly protein PilC [hydrothermal vent metagenome]|uniref:Type II secretory pathway, component PulF / Type IV fimbrial assembly protein PilC n=1 Tax=hydrothermal vent metagenome TaxID=652676 RepID=A0A3B0YAW0_9ZZZZ